MEVKDIQHVLQLAKFAVAHGAETHHSMPSADADKAIEAVETWLREIGALPPR